jgi:hypothetical protein
MDYKKTDIIKSLEELTLVYNNNIDCSKTPKLCEYGILLSQTINKTILFLESQSNNNNNNNNNNKHKLVPLDTNINYEQLAKFKN